MTTLIIPGWHGSGVGHWQDWWLARDPDAVLVRQDDWDNPNLDAWLARAAEAVRREPDSTLVAHSLGCALVVQLALAYPTLRVAGAMLVAPADIDDAGWTPPPIAAFAPMPLRRLPFPSTVVASRTDPYLTFHRARGFAKAWGSSLVDLGDAGHVNDASGFGPWPQGMRLAAELASAPARLRRRA